MNFCFTKPTSTLFTGFDTYQKQYLSHTKQIYEYCDYVVHNASVATVGTYEKDINIPIDTGIATAKSVIVQWHRRPRRLVYRDSSESINDLSDSLSSITNTASLNTAKAAYNVIKIAGGKFNQWGYPPLTVKIALKNLAIVAQVSSVQPEWSNI